MENALLSGSMFSSLTQRGLPCLSLLCSFVVSWAFRKGVSHWHPLVLQSELTFLFHLLIKSRVRIYENSQPKFLKIIARQKLILARK